MTASPAVPLAALRPRAIAELLEVSIALWRREWATFGVLAIAGALPITLIAFAALPFVDRGHITAGPSAIAVALLGILGIIFYLVADAAVMIATSRAYLATPVTATSAMRVAATLAVPIALLSAIKLVVVGLPITGVFAFYRMGHPSATLNAVVATLCWSPYWLCRFVTVPAPVVLEQLGTAAALRRSLALTHGSAWRIALAMAPIGIVYMMLGFVVDLAATLLGRTASATVIVSTAGQLMFLSVVTVFATLLYYDLRVKQEQAHERTAASA